MAKRRELKKDIEYVSSGLLVETMICMLQPNADMAKLEETSSRVLALNDEYIKRAQHPSGNANKPLVKQYYKKLREDFDAEVDKIYAELMSLNKDRTNN